MSTSVDDETILDVLRSNDAPRMTTTEVSGHLPVTRGTTRTRLQRLADDDLLERTTEGNNVVWWLPEREDELDAWEAEQAAAASEDAEAESDPTDEGSDDGEVDDEETTGQESGEPETGDAEPDDTVEVEAVDEAGAVDEPDDESNDDEADDDEADGDATAVEVEAVSEGDSEDVTAAGEELPELSDDDEGLRTVAVVAVALVVVLALRRLLGGD